MNATTDIDTDEGLLNSMIALMLGLAMSAEKAAGRCYAIRCLVLWALHRAAPIALRYVHGLDEAPAFSVFATLFRNSRADALELAALFHAAANVLKAELREVQRFARWWARREARMRRQDRALFPSPLWGGRSAAPGGGESCQPSLAVGSPQIRQRHDHIILTRARIPAWAAINWPDTL